MDWLLKHAPGFNALSDDERQAIAEFSLLWSLFEARVMGEHATAAGIYTTVAGWADAQSLQAETYDPELAYFRKRYFDGTEFTYHFDFLNFGPANKPDLVRAVIAGENNDPADRVAVVHTIVLRFRNNLFHGAKWQSRLAGQFENFRNASSVLMKTLERHGDLGG